MSLSRQERDRLKASFQKMGPADKAGYIWEYYKLPITVGLVALALVCSMVYHEVTKKRCWCIPPSSTSLPGTNWPLS